MAKLLVASRDAEFSPLGDTLRREGLSELLEKMSVMGPLAWNGMTADLHQAIKETKDDVLLQYHK
jgi:hypothetical protein